MEWYYSANKANQIKMTNSQSKPIVLYTPASIAQGELWFKDFVSKLICPYKKTRFRNSKDSVLKWCNGDYSDTIYIDFDDVTYEEFNKACDLQEFIIKVLLHRFSTLDDEKLLFPTFERDGLHFRRQRDFKLGSKSNTVHFSILTSSELGKVMAVAEKHKIPSYCHCGCDEYEKKMKKTACCGRRYVNIVHQRSALINGKCPCKSEK